MSRRLKQVAGVGLVVFAAAQFIRPKSANPPTDASRGRFGPLRSAHIPPATMPTTLAASVTEKAAENQARPSRSALTVGMIVVTASASNAARKIRLTMPIVAQR